MRPQSRFVVHMTCFQERQVAVAKGEALGREAAKGVLKFATLELVRPLLLDSAVPLTRKWQDIIGTPP